MTSIVSPLVRVADNTCASDLSRGEFAYRVNREGRKKWMIFWPKDSPCPIDVALAPQKGNNGASWVISGPDDSPTLHPSVNAVGLWHGWVKYGVAKQ